MESNLPGKTEWESKQYRKDRGHRVAAAQAYRYLAQRIEIDEDFPLPAGSEAVITAAAAAMERLAKIREAASVVYTATRPNRAVA